MRNGTIAVGIFAIAIGLAGCSTTSTLPREQLIITLGEDFAEVLNVDSLSVFPALDTTAVEQPPEPMLQAQPYYPEEARLKRREGVVWAKLWVTKGGNVKKVRIISTDDKLFNEPALRAAVLWQFRPAIIKGEPTAVWVTIPFRFKLK